MAKLLKSKKKNNQKSISTKISSRLLMVLVPSLLILIIVSCMMAASSIETLNNQVLSVQTDNAVETADSFFGNKVESVSMFDHNPIFQAYFKKVSKPGDIDAYENKSAVVGQLKSALDNISDKNVEQVWLADTKTDSYLLSTGEVVDANLGDSNWAEDIISAKKVVISEPFLDPATDKEVISIVSPVFSGSDIIGFVGFDVFMDTLAESLAQIKVGKEGYMELLSTDSEYVYSADDTAMGKNVSELDISQEYKDHVSKKQEGVMDFSYGGTEYTSMSRICSETGWLAIATLPMSEVNATRNQLILVLAVLSILILAVLVFITIVLLRRSMKPLVEIGSNIQEFSKGDLNVDIKVEGEDEIGRLANDVRFTIHTLKEIIGDISHILSEISDGNLDLTVRGNYMGDFMPIREALVKIIGSLNMTLGQINQSTDQVSSGSDQVSSGAQELAQGAAEQASAVEELAASINDISQQINDTADNAAHASDKAKMVGSEVVDSNTRMQEMLTAMTDISTRSKEIGKIIKTIEDIAFQTNILALNAAVEAARAGAAGKGFAVVADEVRNLASKSTEASKSTTTLIEDSLRAVENGTKIADETAQSLVSVVDGVNYVAASIDNISEASTIQANSITQVTTGIDQISSVVQTNSATAEESAAASEELSGQAQILKGLVDQFSLAKADQTQQTSAQTPQVQQHPKSASTSTSEKY